jgi:hypothetical protein
MRALATAIAACLFASALAAQAGWRDEQAYGTWSDRSEFNAQVFNGRVWVFEGGGALAQHWRWLRLVKY